MMTTIELNRAGTKALTEALGFDGMIRFLRQFDKDSGNYTLDRREWIDDLSLDEIFAGIEKEQNNSSEK